MVRYMQKHEPATILDSKMGGGRSPHPFVSGIGVPIGALWGKSQKCFSKQAKHAPNVYLGPPESIPIDSETFPFGFSPSRLKKTVSPTVSLLVNHLLASRRACSVLASAGDVDLPLPRGSWHSQMHPLM